MTQVRARVARGDARLYLIEGKPLLPQSLQTDSLHPTTQGMRPCVDENEPALSSAGFTSRRHAPAVAG